MKSLPKFLALLFAFSAVGVNSSSIASGQRDWQPSPWSIVDQRLNSLGEPGVGVFWDMPNPEPLSSFIEFRQHDGSMRPVGDAILCSGYDDPRCRAQTNSYLSTIAVLGRCISIDEIACIEEIHLASKTRPLSPLAFSGLSGEETAFAQSTLLKMPRGSSISLWSDNAGSVYAANLQISSGLSPRGESWVLSSRQVVNISIVRISSPDCLCEGKYTTTVARLNRIPDGGSQIVSSGNQPLPHLEFDPSTRIKVELRLPSSMSNWFYGRIHDSQISSRSLSGDRILYTIAGDATDTYIAGGVVPSAALPSDRSNHPNHGYAERINRYIPGYSATSIEQYRRWLPYIGDRALATQSRWTAKSVSWTTHACLSSSKGLGGMLGTNASAFDSSPPTWDAATKTLSFKVASPHLDENGAVAQGTYTLALPASSVSCLYGRTQLPAFVQISVTDSKDGQQLTEVTSLSERDGWVSFSAKGFHFSEPTITVRFMDDPNASAARTGSSVQTPRGNFFTASVRKNKSTLSITMTKRQTVKVYRKVGRKTVLLRTLSARKGKTTFTTSYKKSYSFIVKDAKGKTIRRWSPS